MEFALRRGYAHHWGNFVKNVWGQNEMVFWMMWMCLNVWFTLSNFGGRAARDMYKQALEEAGRESIIETWAITQPTSQSTSLRWLLITKACSLPAKKPMPTREGSSEKYQSDLSLYTHMMQMRNFRTDLGVQSPLSPWKPAPAIRQRKWIQQKSFKQCWWCKPNSRWHCWQIQQKELQQWCDDANLIPSDIADEFRRKNFSSELMMQP